MLIAFRLTLSAVSAGRLSEPAGTDTLPEMNTLPAQAVGTQPMPRSRRRACLEKTLLGFNQASIFTRRSFKPVAQSLQSVSPHPEVGR